MVKINRFRVWMLSALMTCSTAWVCAGCQGTGILQEATAVQLEATLISMLGGLLQTLIYNAMDIPAI